MGPACGAGYPEGGIDSPATPHQYCHMVEARSPALAIEKLRGARDKRKICSLGGVQGGSPMTNCITNPRG
jgi:hypothetical protein